MEIAKKIHSTYIPGYAFPSWVLDNWDKHDFESVKVFYSAEESLTNVKILMTEREPCNIGMRRIYSQNLLKEHFGYEQGAYRYSTTDKLMPNLAVYTHAIVKLEKKGFTKVHVVNLIGAGLDHMYQPDYQYFSVRPKEALIAFYRNVWKLAFAALVNSPCKKLQIYNVGGGAFSGPYSANFTTEIFEPAIKPLLPLFTEKGLSVVGYDWSSHEFTGGFIPNCLEEAADLDTTLFVNAWDPWSLIGNGNERDRSLDGYWGRVSNMAVLGWLPTNPHMKFIGV